MAWISTESKNLTPGWLTQLPPDLFREDKTDAEWINLNTGASLVLVADGGWRGAQDGTYESRYRVFHRAAGQTDPVELTYPFLSKARNAGKFEEGAKGTETYFGVRETCIAEIERILREH